MLLHECTLGKMVVCDGDIGFIMGLAVNSHHETVPVVKWDNGREHPCHHHNLEVATKQTIASVHAARGARGAA